MQLKVKSTIRWIVWRRNNCGETHGSGKSGFQNSRDRNEI